MKTEPCPTCKGWCCANHNEKFGPSVHYQHSGTKVHFCPECINGFVDAATPKPPERTAQQEREDVLAYIRRATSYPFPSNGKPALSLYLKLLHDLIAAGDHEGAAERETEP